MKIEHKRIVVEGTVLHNTSEYLTINNSDSDKKYQILYNNIFYDVANVDGKLVFKLPYITKDKVSISLKVYTSNNQFLYLTNTVNVDVLEDVCKDVASLTKEIESLKNDFSHFKNQAELVKSSFIDETPLGYNDKSEEAKVIDDCVAEASFVKTTDATIKSINDIKEAIEFKDEEISNLKKTMSDIKSDIGKLDFQINSTQKSLKESISHLEQDVKENKNYQQEQSKKYQEVLDIVSKNKIESDNANKDCEYKYNLLISEYSELENKLKGLMDRNNNVYLPLNLDLSIPPYTFVSYNDQVLMPYIYNVVKPIGVTGAFGGVIVSGSAVVKYRGTVSVGCYVYGNRGFAEQNSVGFVVTRVIDDTLCEIML